MRAETPEEWIGKLSDEKYQTREAATLELWKLGDAALAQLSEAAASDDPERALRATDLVKKIEMHLTPGTDPQVVGLVEKYLAAKDRPQERLRLMVALKQARAWRPMLKLFQAETERGQIVELAREVTGVPQTAARERILAGDLPGAKELLELGKYLPHGLMALADFHRVRGDLPQEYERSLVARDADGLAWRLALARISGDARKSTAAAVAASSPGLQAVFSALRGDPLPWLKRMEAEQGENRMHQATYARAAQTRWRSGMIERPRLDQLTRGAASRNRQSQRTAATCLLALGEIGALEQVLVKSSPSQAFFFLDRSEKIPEALAAMGLDPDQPDFKKWVDSKAEKFSDPDNEDHWDPNEGIPAVLRMAKFMEGRGLHEQAFAAFEAAMLKLAETNEASFLRLLTLFFGGYDEEEAPQNSAPRLAAAISKKWATEDPARWMKVIEAINDSGESRQWWDWLEALDPKATLPERFDAILHFFGLSDLPRPRAETWDALIRKDIDESAGARKILLIKRMIALRSLSEDAADEAAWLDKLPEKERAEIPAARRITIFRTLERWEDARRTVVQGIETSGITGDALEAGQYALAAGLSRRSGKTEDAERFDVLAEKLALGDPMLALQIAENYRFAGDRGRQEIWIRRAVMWSEPGHQAFESALPGYVAILKQEKKWLEAAALSEIAIAQEVSGANQTTTTGIARLSADLFKALARLKSDRAAALALLEETFQENMRSGALADDFLPLVRDAGLKAESERWFLKSWDGLQEIIRKYPEGENTRNTAAWMASRARLKLDEAAAVLKTALESMPRQAAYLDTMAEIEFARRNRDGAIKWSEKAVNYAPENPDLKDQNQRFRSDLFSE